MDTFCTISFRYASLPRNQNGSVRQEIAAAPPASYSLAISTYGKSGAINPLEGEAFFASQIKDNPSARSACSNAGI